MFHEIGYLIGKSVLLGFRAKNRSPFILNGYFQWLFWHFFIPPPEPPPSLFLDLYPPYFKFTISPEILIRPSRASSSRTRFKSASFSPELLLSLLLSILPPLLMSIQRIRSLGHCVGQVITYLIYFLENVAINAAHMNVPNIASTPAKIW